MSQPASTPRPSRHHSWKTPLPLQEALAKLRYCVDEHEQPKVGDCWDLGQGLGVVLLSQSASPHTPARLSATATISATGLPAWLLDPTSPRPTSATPTTPSPAMTPAATSTSLGNTSRVPRASPVALCDFLARRFQAAVISSRTARAHGIHSDYSRETVGQFVLETNRAAVSQITGTVSVVFDILPAGRGGWQRPQKFQKQQQFEGAAPTQEPCEDGEVRGLGAEIVESVRGVVKQALLNCRFEGGGLDAAAACEHVESVEDQRHLRDLVAASDGIAFVADGSVLPRRGGSDDRPMKASEGAVPFKSPESLRKEFRLPHRGIVKGMLVPRGVTVIVGGGYHGKSTLLRALAVGVFDKIPGDGRELAVTDPGAVTIRAEDGRPVSGVDISPFISSLPSSAVSTESKEACPAGKHGVENADGSTSGICEGMTTQRFSTEGASGSTSQAANVIEALEAGATGLLLDEDTCAGNFMIRDSRMRAMVHHEPITPFIYRVSSLWLEQGVSSVIVVGGCGDYFDVHNTAILVDNYIVSDATERAHSISRRFCVGRVQYAGRGLVHRLPWPENSSPRAIVPESILGSSREASGPPATNRKRDHESENDNCGETAEDGSAGSEGGGLGCTNVSSVGGAPNHGSGGSALFTASAVQNGGAGEGGDEHQDTAQQRGEQRRYPQTGEGIVFPTKLCGCPCFCGRHGKCITASIGRDIASTSADLSRVEQLVGGAAMARGCALGVEFVARATERSPGLSVSGALDLLDATIMMRDGDGGERRRFDGGGLASLFDRAAEREPVVPTNTREEQVPASTAFLGGPLVVLPRRFEVAAALHRLPGIQFGPAVSLKQ